MGALTDPWISGNEGREKNTKTKPWTVFMGDYIRTAEKMHSFFLNRDNFQGG